MEVAFISSNKLRFELDKKYNNLTSSIISIFFKNSQQFISTMLVGKFLSMVVFGLLITESLTFAFEGALSPFISILLQITIATVVIIIFGEFIPRAIFKINPNMWLRLFSWVLLFFYIVLYPISWFSSWASSKFFSLFKISLPASTEENVFSRIDLNYLLQENLDTKNDQKEMEHEVKIFQKALDFSTVKLRDCFVPRTEIVALEYGVDVNILKQTFIETGLSKIIIYKGDIDNITGYIHSSEMFEHRKDWTKYIRQIPIVPENMAAQKLM
jgi:CBS domain containing-hemolysin-like protein